MSALRKYGGLGRFWVTMHFLEQYPKEVAEVLKGVIVTRAEAHYAEGHIEYTGFSPHFRILEPGERAPFYLGTVAIAHTADNDGKETDHYHVTWDETEESYVPKVARIDVGGYGVTVA